MAQMVYTMLRLPAVTTRTGLSRSTIYARIEEGTIPKPISLGGRAVGWPDFEIDAVNQARLQGKTDTEVRDLVAQLVRARSGSFDSVMEKSHA